MNGKHFHLRHCRSRHVLYETAGMHVAQTAVGADPQISNQVIKAIVGADPHASVMVLGDCSNEIICESVQIGPAHRVAACNAVDPITVCAGP